MAHSPRVGYVVCRVSATARLIHPINSKEGSTLNIIKTSFVIMFIACGMLASNLAFSGSSPPDTSEIVSACETNWNSSSASQTCSSTTFKNSGGQCKIGTTCQRSGGTTSSSITVDAGSANNIWNCNGVLQTSKC